VRFLKYEESRLSVENAEILQEIAGLEANVGTARVEAAEKQIERHKIASPLDGVVVEVYRRAGEWVQPGEPVLRVVRMNRLRIKGELNFSQYAPREVAGKPVTVSVPLERGRQETFKGKVVFAEPDIRIDGTYDVLAEVDNRSEGSSGHWLLVPGIGGAIMTIHLK
jgi:multidrug resistance efflux pump